VQAPGAYRHLTDLSLIQNQQDISTGFRTCDIGMFLLSRGCKGLESVVLDGFSAVSNAGFTLVLTTWLNLKKFEFQNSWGAK
ncbi:F-box domain, cyclin-like protein, partial [Tanacetum coccineum]